MLLMPSPKVVLRNELVDDMLMLEGGDGPERDAPWKVATCSTSIIVPSAGLMAKKKENNEENDEQFQNEFEARLMIALMSCKSEGGRLNCM